MNTTTIKIAICSLILFSCNKEIEQQINQSDFSKTSFKQSASPNIVLIVADDFGYELPGFTGGRSYQTPNLDALARRGIQCAQVRSAPNCSPSRIMLLTGKYNFRNYSNWGILDTSQYTIANALQDNGYATCVAGKWQLDGGSNSIKAFGFDAHSVVIPFAATAKNAEIYRYKNPHIYQDGMYLPDEQTNGKYADDMFGDYMYNFIDSVGNKPFFILYTLSLCHFPFSPTPDDPEFNDWDPELLQSDKKYFPSMVKYTDKKVGQLIKKIRDAGVDDNTVIMFTSDNGSPGPIESYFKNIAVQGGKGETNEFGTHVPFIFYDPSIENTNKINRDLIDFTDLLPTIADLADIQIPSQTGTIDGKSFLPGLYNNSTARDWVFCHWKPASKSDERYKRFIHNKEYKLYDNTYNNYFFHFTDDMHETSPIPDEQLTPKEAEIKRRFQEVLNQMHN